MIRSAQRTVGRPIKTKKTAAISAAAVR